MAGTTHTYRTSLRWSGSTGVGYEGYDRAHQLTVAGPTDGVLDLSSDAAFRGDPARMNPEQLLVAAASSCQLLAFLAVAARARLDVRSYVDDASAVMPEDDPPMRITRIELRPAIHLADTDRARPSDERLAHLVHVAHTECFIANSLRSEVTVDGSFHWLSTLRGVPPSGAADT